ncbi:hypothetical protein DM872_22200 [Pseudomonas taiwanensis]|uniref:hypothetical protein n=1 Tax=Pseudomonas taiwanensis TaxID=470150 RepID=UPI0015BA8425|nr:hypothetical protein [Pseudomonas taiwanensis]NWL79566.1 hypothetical protein [Pseudomonas taiwanensis]
MTKKTIEDFLNRKVADAYSIKNHSLFRVLLEIYAGGKRLKCLYDSEIMRISDFRQDLASALATNQESQARIAGSWISFLKPRIDFLEYWSWLFGALATVLAALVTMMNLAGQSSLVGNTVMAVLALIFAMIKFSVDKKRYWYKYIVSHLDAIKVGS